MLGAGGMGTVWKAFDSELRRTVALKQIRGSDASAESLARFEREARLAARLRHPNIVAVHDVGRIEGQHFLTMDLVEGRTLTEYLEETRAAKLDGRPEGAARLREEIDILAAVAEAIACAHAEGIIHRDLKPGNVMLDRDRRPHVMDFGLAKEVSLEAQAGARLSVTGQMLGTPAYMCPEQAAGDLGKIGPASDVWALGVMLYEILAGSTPWTGSSAWAVIRSILDDEAPRAVGRHPYVPVELEAIYLRAVEREPARRYPSAAEFARELRRWLAGEAVLARPANRIERARRWLHRRRRTAIAAACLVGGLAAAVGWAAFEGRREHEQARRWLADLGRTVAGFEDEVRRTDMPAEARAAAAEQPLGAIELVIRTLPEFGPAYSWRGRVNELIGRTAEAEADLELGCRRSPAFAVTWYLRGAHRLERYRLARGLPNWTFGDSGAKAEAVRAETREEHAWREGGLEDLRRMEAAEAQDDTFGAEEARLGRATAALAMGAADDYARVIELTKGITGPRAARLRGVAFYQLQRLEEATAAFADALAAWPQDGETHLYAADAWAAIGDRQTRREEDPGAALARALREYRSAARLLQGYASIFNNGGLVRTKLACIESGKHGGRPEEFEAALADFAEALRVNPALSLARVNRGSVRLDQAQAEEERGGDPESFLGLALVEYDEALGDPFTAPVAHYGRSRTWRARGLHLVRTGGDPRDAFAQGVTEAEAAGRMQPDLVDARFLAAYIQEDLGDWEAARKVGDPQGYRAALAIADGILAAHPDSAEAHLLRGEIRRKTGAAAKSAGVDPQSVLAFADADYDDALRLRADSWRGSAGRAANREILAEWQQARGEDPRPALLAAVAECDAAVARNGRACLARLARAEALIRLARTDENPGRDAAEFLQRAIGDADAILADHPDDADAWVTRGNAHADLADQASSFSRESEETLRAALEDYRHALNRQANCPGALQGLGVTLRKLGDLETARGADGLLRYTHALESLNRLIARHPAEPAYLMDRSDVHVSLASQETGAERDARDAYRRALEDLSAALRIDPSLAVTQVKRAGVLLNLSYQEEKFGGDASSQAQNAMDDAERAAKLDPRLPDALIVRATARQRIAELTFVNGAPIEPPWDLVFADLDAAIRIRPGMASAHFLRGEARTSQARNATKRGQDARAVLQAAIGDFDAALDRGRRDAGTSRARGQAWAMLAEQQRDLGEDPQEAFEHSVQDCDAALALAPDDRKTLLARGEFRYLWSRWIVRKGLPPGDRMTRAEADLRRAGELGEPEGWRDLAQFLEWLGKPADAADALEALGKARPAEVEALAPRIAGLRRAATPTGEDWRRELDRAEKLLIANDYPRAREEYEKGLALLDVALAALAEDRRAQMLAEPATRGQASSAHYNLACIESLLSAGVDRPGATPVPLDEEIRRGHRERALDHLERAFRLGFDDRALLGQDATLDPIRDDPRFRALAGEKR